MGKCVKEMGRAENTFGDSSKDSSEYASSLKDDSEKSEKSSLSSEDILNLSDKISAENV